MPYLSKNFTLEELSITGTGIPNVPNSDEIANLTVLAQSILQPIRDKFGPIIVTDAYRCDSVNTAVGGKANSQHRLGEAADIVPITASINAVATWCITNLKFGQLINEEENGKRWLHISLPRSNKPNQQALIYHDGGYKPYA